jgi:hypothetical protein
MLYQLQMDISSSIVRPMTNLIDRKCSKFNEEIDILFGLWSTTYFWLIFDPFKILVQIPAYRRLDGRLYNSARRKSKRVVLVASRHRVLHRVLTRVVCAATSKVHGVCTSAPVPCLTG